MARHNIKLLIIHNLGRGRNKSEHFGAIKLTITKVNNIRERAVVINLARNAAAAIASQIVANESTIYVIQELDYIREGWSDKRHLLVFWLTFASIL